MSQQPSERKDAALPHHLSVVTGEGVPTLFDLPAGARAPSTRVPLLDRPIWSEHKATLVAEYLRLFCFVTQHGTYIDGFAGPQHPGAPETWAARLVLANQPQRSRHFYLFDNDRRQHDRLCQLRDEIAGGRHVEVVLGDFNTSLRLVVRSSRIGEREATFCLLDQRCFECYWATVEVIARFKKTRKIEILYFMPEGWLDRALSAARQPQTLAEIRAWWGRDDWAALRGVSGVRRAELFVDRFRELGYRYVLPWPIYKRSRGGAPGRVMYYMIHASDHPEAPKFMGRAYNSCVRSDTERNGLRQTQLSL